MGIAPEQLHLSDESCEARSNGTHYVLTIEFRENRMCGSKILESTRVLNIVQARPNDLSIHQTITDDEDINEEIQEL